MAKAQAERRRAIIADVRWILRTDPTANAEAIAERLNMEPRSLERYLYRQGRADLVHRIAERTPRRNKMDIYWSCGGVCCRRRRRVDSEGEDSGSGGV